jgi:MoaA/NifB/PqqE/SkfB family radical SAM enzyme
MRAGEVMRGWKAIALGRRPFLSIEVTRECPLRCPGCYAYEDNHLGGLITLRELRDSKGDDLVTGILQVVDHLRPLHISLVGGDPLVRYREMEALIPQLLARGLNIQLVTSAFRGMPEAWSTLEKLKVVVSIDGLQPDHDVRRKPATYERILKNIENQKITVHCTITAPMVRPGYLEEFVAFWSARGEVKQIWCSIFTPQRGAKLAEIPTSEQRSFVLDELLQLRLKYPKLDMRPVTINAFRKMPVSPDDCIFARTTETISADLSTRVTPCQFGGDPDCEQCGCIASAGLAALGSHKLAGFIPLGAIFRGSVAVGSAVRALSRPKTGRPPAAMAGNATAES